MVEELASQLPADTTRLVRLPEARHTIFRDRPVLAFPAVKTFVAQIGEAAPPTEPRCPAKKTGPQPARSRNLCGPGHHWPRFSWP